MTDRQHQLERLKRLAMFATQGARQFNPRGSVDGSQVVTVHSEWGILPLLTVKANQGPESSQQALHDAEFYAALSPVRVTELVDLINFQEAEIGRLNALPLRIPPATNPEEEKYRQRLLRALEGSEFNIALE